MYFVQIFFFLEQLKQICKEYFDRMYMCESQKYDMEFEVRKRDFEVLEPRGFVSLVFLFCFRWHHDYMSWR